MELGIFRDRGQYWIDFTDFAQNMLILISMFSYWRLHIFYLLEYLYLRSTPSRVTYSILHTPYSNCAISMMGTRAGPQRLRARYGQQSTVNI